MDIEAIFFGEHTLVARVEAGIGDDNGGPARPDIDGELDDELPILRALRVIADACDRGDARALDERGRIRAGEEGNVRGRSFGRLNRLLDLVHIERDVVALCSRSDFVPPAVHAEADNTEQQDG